MQIGYAVTSRPTANKLNIHINNEAFFVDVFIGFANLMLDPLFGQLRSVDNRSISVMRSPDGQDPVVSMSTNA